MIDCGPLARLQNGRPHGRPFSFCARRSSIGPPGPLEKDQSGSCEAVACSNHRYPARKGECAMTDLNAERTLIVVFRLLMAWTFIYAASHQAFVDFSVVGFLNSTKTFHNFF